MIVGMRVCVLERERLHAHARARKSKGVGSDSGDRRYCGNASLCFIEATVLRDCLSIGDRRKRENFLFPCCLACV